MTANGQLTITHAGPPSCRSTTTCDDPKGCFKTKFDIFNQSANPRVSLFATQVQTNDDEVYSLQAAINSARENGHAVSSEL